MNAENKKLSKDQSLGLANYEAVLVMDPSLTKEVQKKFFQKLRKCIIEEYKGSIYHIDTWGVRNLLNQNRKRWKQGLYFHFSFQAKKGVVKELTRRVQMAEEILYSHFQKLAKHSSLEANLKSFREMIEISIKRESERQARIEQRKKHQMSQNFSSNNKKNLSSPSSLKA